MPVFPHPATRKIDKMLSFMVLVDEDFDVDKIINSK